MNVSRGYVYRGGLNGKCGLEGVGCSQFRHMGLKEEGKGVTERERERKRARKKEREQGRKRNRENDEGRKRECEGGRGREIMKKKLCSIHFTLIAVKFIKTADSSCY